MNKNFFKQQEMEICHHIIEDDQITGIGPLMDKRSPDLAIHQLYNSRQLWFYLHMKHNTIIIESEWFEIGEGTSDAEKVERANYKAWTRLYDDARAYVISLLERKRMHNENNS